MRNLWSLGGHPQYGTAAVPKSVTKSESYWWDLEMDSTPGVVESPDA